MLSTSCSRFPKTFHVISQKVVQKFLKQKGKSCFLNYSCSKKPKGSHQHTLSKTVTPFLRTLPAESKIRHIVSTFDGCTTKRQSKSCAKKKTGFCFFEFNRGKSSSKTDHVCLYPCHSPSRSWQTRQPGGIYIYIYKLIGPREFCRSNNI